MTPRLSKALSSLPKRKYRHPSWIPEIYFELIDLGLVKQSADGCKLSYTKAGSVMVQKPACMCGALEPETEEGWDGLSRCIYCGCY